jgi:hypothetical protein
MDSLTFRTVQGVHLVGRESMTKTSRDRKSRIVRGLFGRMSSRRMRASFGAFTDSGFVFMAVSSLSVFS